MEGTLLIIAVAVFVAVIGIGLAAIRIVPTGECGVVLRAGRVVRTSGSGTVLVVIPFYERVETVPLGTRTLDPLNVAAMTHDGIDIHLTLSVLWQVRDPARAVGAGSGTQGAVADAVERRIHGLVGRTPLANLVSDPQTFLIEAAASTNELLGPVGMEVLDIDVVDTDIRVSPELLRLLA